ncbi:MAG: glycoside hydrolase [Candidatus Dormibacteraeota bacterium]|nr:glycoside hydrolase [Candidatus Dormibacteraeota bacterium]
MRGLSRARAVLLCTSAVGIALSAGASSPVTRARAASPPTFASPIKLPTSTGGEPSLAIDYGSCTAGVNCKMYIVSPNATASGPAEWYSYDSGATWGTPVQIDTQQPTRGGDTDVTVQPGPGTNTGNVIVTDLNVSNSFVQVSTDHGKTFNTGFPTAYEDDRPWLTAAGQSTVYLAYHDFVGEVPIVCKSTDGGVTFISCTHAFTNTSVSDCVENTVPARYFVVDPTDATGNTLNFMYACSTLAENAAHPPYGPLHDYYLAQSTDGGTTYLTTHTVFHADTSGGKAPNYANIFGNFAEDAAGNYYAMFSGTADDHHVLSNPFHVYYVWSPDKGKTWNGPYRVDTDAAGTHTLASFAVTGAGNIDAVWYGDPANTGEPNGQCGSTGQATACQDGTTYVGMDGQNGKACPAATPPATTSCPVTGNWKVYMTQTTNANTVGGATWSAPQAIDPNYRHYGTICTNGIVCGGASDRHLLDFISVAVDCGGLAHVTYGADQNTSVAHTVPQSFTDGALETDVVNQTGGQALAAPLGCAGAAVITPEVPLAALLPLGALLAVAAVGIGRRRRRSAATA